MHPLADALNRRYAAAGMQPSSALAAAGVLIHQYDGMEDPQKPWGPCRPGACTQQRQRERQARVSASMIFGGMFHEGRRDRRALPLFSYDGGVVLSPAHTKVNCGYGADGHIDDSYKISDGCGGPRCSAAAPVVQPNNCLCGFANCGGSIMPWRAEDLGPLLATFAQRGARYTGYGAYNGYNEIVLDAATWLRNLPHSVEAMFVVDCAPRARNTPYSASRTCAGAQQTARRNYDAFVAEYGLSEATFPLLRLSPDELERPFSAA